MILPAIVQRPPEWLTDFFASFAPYDDALEPFLSAHPDNMERLKALQWALMRKEERVGCFAGAGVSAGYRLPTWHEFLQRSAVRMGAEALVAEALAEWRYEDAAQALDDHDHAAFEEVLREILSHRHLAPEPRGSAALLPFLPFDFVVTTNFDHVLDHVYELAGMRLRPVIYGATPEFARAAMKEGMLPLLKIHGDYLYERILTRSQYERFYSPHSPLMRELVELFASIRFVFVGFSLRDEKIREALRLARREGPARHFVLLQAESPQAALEQEAAFAELGVTPLWYVGDHRVVERVLGLLASYSRPNPDLVEVAKAVRGDRVGEALEACRRLLAERPQCHLFRMAYAWSLADSIDWGECLLDRAYVNDAIARIDEARGSVHDFADAYAVRALMNHCRFSFGEAVRDIDRALELGSHESELLRASRGMYRLFFLRDPDGAREDLDTAVAALTGTRADEMGGYLRFFSGGIGYLKAEPGAVDQLLAALDEPCFAEEKLRDSARGMRAMLRLVRPLWKPALGRRVLAAPLRWGLRFGPVMAWAGQAGIIAWVLRRQFRRDARRRARAAAPA